MSLFMINRLFFALIKKNPRGFSLWLNIF